MVRDEVFGGARSGENRSVLLTTVRPGPVARAEQVAPLLKALADPVRLRLMSLVASHPGGEACACDLGGAFDLSQPTISHHLKVLHDAGLVDREKRGVWVYYRAHSQALTSLSALIGCPPSSAGPLPNRRDSHRSRRRLQRWCGPPALFRGRRHLSGSGICRDFDMRLF